MSGIPAYNRVCTRVDVVMRNLGHYAYSSHGVRIHVGHALWFAMAESWPRHAPLDTWAPRLWPTDLPVILDPQLGDDELVVRLEIRA